MRVYACLRTWYVGEAHVTDMWIIMCSSAGLNETDDMDLGMAFCTNAYY